MPTMPCTHARSGLPVTKMYRSTLPVQYTLELHNTAARVQVLGAKNGGHFVVHFSRAQHLNLYGKLTLFAFYFSREDLNIGLFWHSEYSKWLL